MATTTINLGLSLDGLSNVDSTGKVTGDVLEWNAVTSKWEAATPSGGGGGSGVFGISDTSGVYTYYATLTLAMTAAVAGQTIEMFANVTETGAVEITLKNGVNINGNGYTYTLNNNGLIHAFKTTASVLTSCSISNLNVIRTGSTASGNDNTVLQFDTSSSGTINCIGCTFTNSGSGRAILIKDNCTITLIGAVANSSSEGIRINAASGSKIIRCQGNGIGSGIGIIINNSNAFFCVGTSNSGVGFFSINANNNILNCIGESISSDGFSAIGNVINCIGKSTSGVGFFNQGVSTKNCTGLSVSGVGVRNLDNCIIYFSFGKSSSDFGATNGASGKIIGGFYQSSSSAVIRSASSSQLKNIFISCLWNNSAGYGVIGQSGSICNQLINCQFELSNSSAPYLFNGGTAQAISMRGNTYQGGAAFNINLTQAIIAVEDAQGNIFL
jgi:hypothetical protein